jgi:ribosomal protein S27E
MLEIKSLEWSPKGEFYTIYCTECKRRFTCPADAKKVGCQECRDRVDTVRLEERWKAIPRDVAQEEYYNRLESLLEKINEKRAAKERLESREDQST